jgi:hypothetical protein
VPTRKPSATAIPKLIGIPVYFMKYITVIHEN